MAITENEVKYFAGELDKEERKKSDTLYTPSYIGRGSLWVAGIVAFVFIAGVATKLYQLLHI